jgi:hypothetical protein
VQDAGSRSVCCQAGSASHGVTAPFRVSTPKQLAPVLVRCAPHALYRYRPGSRVFAETAFPDKRKANPELLSWACALLQSTPKRRAAAEALGKPSTTAPPLRFGPLQRIPARDKDMVNCPGDTSPETPCAFRFSQPPDALHRPVPAGPISDQIRSWGFPYRAFLLSCSRTPSPGPIPS